MQSSSLSRIRSRRSYYFWAGIFFASIIGLLTLLIVATAKIDYVWRINRMPSYFASQETVEIKNDLMGTVTQIMQQGDQATIVVKGDRDEGEKSYTVPTGDIRVDEGDFAYPGDTLATYQEWRTGILAQGMWITLKVSIYSIFFGIILGLVGGIARISTNPALKWSAITYVEIIRGSPLLVQIFIWYFVLATLVNELLRKAGIAEIPALWYGIAALATFTGAYTTEIVRAGIQSIHRGQIEAARSLGMSNAQSLLHIVLPQAMRRILPPLAGQFISLIKDSSLLGIIAIRELTKATREAITTSLQPYEFWFVCAILYLVLTFSLSMFVQYLERRMANQ